ncbi:lipopolysaccharide assembly protein LapB [Salinisphaera aquimarina]|uniref:Lipopolysaccharide assembly protein B n=1 Tax=Salinisphaera aquimarina TaxID=2094031 RepID=A0ABV7ESG4_9GAMM
MLDGIWWVFLALLPLAAASGWYARGRATGEDEPTPPVNADYLRGISQLVNDDADRAIATFVRLLEVDNDTAETHLALGNLFRRQGEVDRALRMHQNLVARPNLKAVHRNQARYELAQDYLRAGVLDRAENLFRELADQNLFLERSLSGLVAIYEQGRDWEQAIDTTRRLETVRGTSLRPVIAQYFCELAEQARGNQAIDQAHRFLKSARHSFRDCARTSLIGGLMAEHGGDHRGAIRIYRQVLRQDIDFSSEIIEPMRRCFDAIEDPRGYADFLRELMPLYDGAHPHVAYARLLHRQKKSDEAIAHISEYLQGDPNWIGFYHLLDLTWSQTRSNLTGPLDSLRQSLGQIIERQPTYHCGQCGFSGRYLHWQCPSCRQWNTIVPVRDVRPGEPAPTRAARIA